MADREVRAAVELQADVLRCITSLTEMLRLVTAVAGRHRAGARVMHDRGGALPVEHVRDVVGERGFVDQRAPDWSFASEDLTHERIVAMHVGIERFGHPLLGDQVVLAHHRQLKEPCHRGCEQV